MFSNKILPDPEGLLEPPLGFLEEDPPPPPLPPLGFLEDDDPPVGLGLPPLGCLLLDIVKFRLYQID